MKTIKTANYKKAKSCPVCHGSGQYGRFGDCNECNGTGSVPIN